MAGAAGFEPAHVEIKTRCLTAWLRPNQSLLSCCDAIVLSRSSTVNAGRTSIFR